MPNELDASIKFPYESNPWLFRVTLAILAVLPLTKFGGPIIAVGVVAIAYLTTLLRPVGLNISCYDRRLVYRYSPLIPFKKDRIVSLAGFTRVYTEVYGYGGRALHMSGARGEYIVLAKFHQNIFAPKMHLNEITELRKQIATSLGITDGGDV